MWNLIKPRPKTLWLWQLSLLVLLFVFWHVMTVPGLIPPMMFDNERQAAFFFGEPLQVAARIWAWFVTDADIYPHLGVTLAETLMADTNRAKARGMAAMGDSTPSTRKASNRDCESGMMWMTVARSRPARAIDKRR